MSAGALTALLHLCDSLFPTGGYAHSDGLEAAADGGGIIRADDLHAWLATLLDDTLARGDGPTVMRAHHAWRAQAWTALRILDDEAHALRPSSTARQASRGVGSRLLKTWAQLYPSANISRLIDDGAAWTLPVAFASAAASAGCDTQTTVEAFMYTRLSSAISAAMRLMRIGQLEAHRALAGALRRVPEVTAAVLRRDEPPASFTPLADIAALRQQYVTTRLFRS